MADTDTWESTARAIVRCAKCKQPHRVDFTTRTELRAWNNRPSYSHAVWVAREAGQPKTLATYRDRYDLPRILCRRFACSRCGGTRIASFKVVEGHVSEAVRCGAKCQGAVGPSCECSCGGGNHGAAHKPIA